MVAKKACHAAKKEGHKLSDSIISENNSVNKPAQWRKV